MGEINWVVTICSLTIQVNDLVYPINGNYCDLRFFEIMTPKAPKFNEIQPDFNFFLNHWSLLIELAKVD